MQKKRTVLLPISLILMLLISSTFVAADLGEEFDQMFNAVEGMFSFLDKLFSMPMFQDPNTCLGIILFLIWIMLFAILYAGAQAVRLPQRQSTIVCLALSLLTVIMLNFQRALLVMLLGNWIYFLFLAGVAAAIWFISRIQSPRARLIPILLLLLFTWFGRGVMHTAIKQVESLLHSATPYTYRNIYNSFLLIGPLFAIMKKRFERQR